MYEEALHIVQTLKNAGHLAYFAGGWVRDYLLKTPSFDIDIATSASPDEVVELFERAIPIGKAFGVVMVLQPNQGFEVTSFRKDSLYVDGRRPESITFSTPEEDAKRRDFTINGLFYDPVENRVFDYVGGAQDLEKKIIRTIGDPLARFEEDRLRMIRAVRFATSFKFSIDPKTESAIVLLCDRLYPAVAKERVWQEFKKIHATGHFVEGLYNLKRLKLADVIFPPLTNLSLKEVQQLLEGVKTLPSKTFLMLKFAELFSFLSAEETLSLFSTLKISNQEKLDLLFALFCTELARKDSVSSAEWVYFFSHPLFQEAIPLLLFHKQDWDEAFLQDCKNTLRKPIDRKKNGVTLLRADDLRLEGIPPSKLMGKLLKEGEQLAIEHNLHTKEEVLSVLRAKGLMEP